MFAQTGFDHITAHNRRGHRVRDIGCALDRAKFEVKQNIGQQANRDAQKELDATENQITKTAAKHRIVLRCQRLFPAEHGVKYQADDPILIGVTIAEMRELLGQHRHAFRVVAHPPVRHAHPDE